jgi:hypothetical protein
MITERKLIALISVAFLIGLGGGYFISKNQPQIENLFGIKTWHTVTTFNLTMSNNTSPTFFISGEKWRITWEAIVPSALGKTGSNVDFGQISILIYNESMPDREFTMRSFIWCDLTGEDIHSYGVYYINGKGYYFIKLRTIAILPYALTVTFKIESYQ